MAKCKDPKPKAYWRAVKRCEKCEGYGIVARSLDPAYDVPCGECRGDGFLFMPRSVPTDYLIGVSFLRPNHKTSFAYQSYRNRLRRKAPLPDRKMP